jgi:hypothetical protein
MGALVDRAAGLPDCEIVAVSTPQSALEQIKGGQTIDLVVVDDANGGSDILSTLRYVRPFCPAIVVSAAPTLDGALVALRAGAVDYLPKPIVEDALGAAIAAGLAKYQLALRLRKTQQLTTVGEIVGGVAHDFNNLLVVITNFAELITEMCHAETDSSIAEMADSITQAGKSAAALTRQLLELARHKDPVAEPVDLHEVLTETEKVLRSAMGAHNKLVIGPVPLDSHAMADRGHLENVLLNLAVYARDTMPTGSTLSIEGKHRKSAVCIVVHASGATMSDKARAHLFEPFFSTRETTAGSGFGLATARDLIEAVGGTLTASAAADGGTTFCVELPAAESDA